MTLSLRQLVLELLVEAAFGKKFILRTQKNGKEYNWIGMATANAKPNERPYRITWFLPDFSENRHVDLTLDEMQSILDTRIFPPEIVDRIRKRYPDSDLIGDEYKITS